jgi:hypothetical protein
LGACDIGIELLEPELQLVGIQPLGATAKLAALEPSDDEAKLLDLAIALLHTSRHIAYDLVE